MDNGEPLHCGGGLRVDAIELLGVVGPGAIAQPGTAEQATSRRDQAREALGRDSEPARYAADAAEQYDAADPARPAGGWLEARWNQALACVAIESRSHREAIPEAGDRHGRDRPPRRKSEDGLDRADDGRTVKKRIVRTLIHEINGRYRRRGFRKVRHRRPLVRRSQRDPLAQARRGQRSCTSARIAVRELALIASGDLIAGLLNRSSRPAMATAGPANAASSLRSHHRIPVFKTADDGVDPGSISPMLRVSTGIASKTLRLAAEAGSEARRFHGRHGLRSSHA